MGEIARQEKCQQTGRPFRVHLSKLRLYQNPEAYPGQHNDLFRPGAIGALGDGSTDDGEEDDALLQMPMVQMPPEDAAKEEAEHFFMVPDGGRDLKDEIDQLHPGESAPA